MGYGLVERFATTWVGNIWPVEVEILAVSYGMIGAFSAQRAFDSFIWDYINGKPKPRESTEGVRRIE